MSDPARTAVATSAGPLSPPELEIIAPAEPTELTPPVAPIDPRIDIVHGETRVDDYYWLRERDNPEVMAYLEAENRHTEAAMRHTEVLQESLYHEMRDRIQETDLSVPERRDQYLYYTRTEAGRQYPIFCRRRDEAGQD